MTELQDTGLATLTDWINPHLFKIVKKLCTYWGDREQNWKQMKLEKVDKKHRDELKEEAEFFNKKLRITTQGIVVKRNPDEDAVDGQDQIIKCEDDEEIIPITAEEEDSSDEEIVNRKRKFSEAYKENKKWNSGTEVRIS